jgi:hypothetical protein
VQRHKFPGLDARRGRNSASEWGVCSADGRFHRTGDRLFLDAFYAVADWAQRVNRQPCQQPVSERTSDRRPSRAGARNAGM